MIQKQYELLFDGRTLCVECVFIGVNDATELAAQVDRVAGGPKLRMRAGTVNRRPDGLSTKTFINTDESEWEVAKRFNRMNPKPGVITVGIMAPEDAAKLWSQFHKLPYVKEGN